MARAKSCVSSTAINRRSISSASRGPGSRYSPVISPAFAYRRNEQLLIGHRLASPDNHSRAHRNPIVKIDDVVVGHAKASGRNRLADRLRLVRAVNAIECRSKIQGSCPQGILEATRHETRQVRTPSKHFRWRKPVGPFPLRTDAESASPTVPIATHANAVTNSLAMVHDEIQPPFACVDVNGSWPVVALKTDNGAGNWPRPVFAVIKEVRIENVSCLLSKGECGPTRHHHDRKKKSRKSLHLFPRNYRSRFNFCFPNGNLARGIKLPNIAPVQDHRDADARERWPARRRDRDQGGFHGRLPTPMGRLIDS